MMATTTNLLQDELQLLNPGSSFQIPAGEMGLREGVELLRAGKSAEAAFNAALVIKAQPNSAAAHYLLGASRLQMGDVQKGVESINRAMELEPRNTAPLMLLGRAYLRRSDFEHAQETFARVLKIEPNSPEAHRGLGLAYEQQGRNREAIAHYETGITNLPKEILGSRVNLARLYNSEQQFRETVNLLAPLVTDTQTNVTALEFLGVAYMGVGRFDDAIRIYERAFSISPSAEVALGLGVVCRNARRHKESIKHLQDVIQKRPTWSPGHFQLGETYLAMGNPEMAVKHLQNAEGFGTETEKIKAAVRIGEIHALQTNYTKAIEVFDRLAAKPNATWDIFERLAFIYRVNNQPALAEQTLKTAILKYPKQLQPEYELGRFYQAQRQPEKAVAQFEKAVKLEPNNVLVQRSLSAALSQIGQRDKAIQIAETLVVKYPAVTDLKLHLASLYTLDGKDADASKLYQDVLKVEPERALALNNLAMIHARAGNFKEAERLSRKAISLAPKNGQLIDSLGWILYLKGDTAEALSLLTQASGFSPQDPSILYHLGMALLKQNQKAASLERFKQAVAISKTFPEFAQTTKAIQQLTAEMNK